MAEKKAKDSTPIVETNAQGMTITSYTQYENKLLLGIIANCQRDIRSAITQQTNDKTYNPAFTAEEIASTRRIVRIPLSKLEPRTGHRARAKHALLDMPGRQIHVPYEGKGKCIKYASFTRLFDVDFEMKGHRIIVVLTFPIEVLRYLLSIDLGYHYIDPSTLFVFTHNCTRQMMRIYKSYFALGKTTIDAKRLAAIMSPKIQFATFNDIKNEVLQPAKMEMDIAYQNGLCDIHFDFSRKTDADGVAGAQKQQLVFTFYTRQDETLSPDRQAELENCQAKVWFALKHRFGVCDHTAHDLASKVKIWMQAELDELLAHKLWFAEKMQKKGSQHFNRAGYIVKALSAFFTRMNRQKSESDGHRDPQSPPSPIDPTGQYKMHE